MIDLTILLRKALGGDKAAEEEALRLLYPELRRIAAALAAAESSAATLNPSAVISEFYLQKFAASSGIPENIADRNHFLSIAARGMRQVLIDKARSRSASKRRPPENPNFFSAPCTALPHETVLALEAALTRLQAIDPLVARIVELIYYLGCSQTETAAILGISTDRVRKEWLFARDWLQHQLT